MCGNYLTFDKVERYRLNITDKIDKLKKNLDMWKGRNLSLNGKILIVKTFGLSQLSFVNQFCNMSASDLKKVESICYKFIWNGIDCIKRSYLKNEHCDGGLRSIDIESYTLALKLRNFLKADKHCRELSIIQNSLYQNDAITLSARTTIYKINKCTLADLDIKELDRQMSIELFSTKLRSIVKPYSKAEALLVKYNLINLSDLLSNSIPRGKKNIILKSLPNCLKISNSFINENSVMEQVSQLVFYKRKSINIYVRFLALDYS